MKRTLILLFTMVSLSLASGLQGQTTPEWVRVECRDGSVIIGKQLAETQSHLVVESPSLGPLNLRREQIKSIRSLLAPPGSTGLYLPNVSDTRFLLSQSAYSLKKGEGYYQNFLLFFNQVGYGITDNFSINVGVEILSLLVGANLEEGLTFPGFTVAPKATFPLSENRIHIGIGGLLFNLPYSDAFIDFGGVFGNLTVGPHHSHLSLGIGFGYVEDELTGSPLVTLSGLLRVKENFALLTENWIIPEGGGAVVTFGGRYLADKIHWDFSFSAVASEDEFFISPIPLIGVTLPFGRK